MWFSRKWQLLINEIDSINTHLVGILKEQRKIMATVTDIQNQLTVLSTSLSDIQTKINTLKNEISTGVPQAALDSISSSLTQLQTLADAAKAS